MKKVLILLLIAYSLSLTAAHAESSVNIPLHHWAYDDLEQLHRAELVNGTGLITKPITRMEAARLIEEAIYRIQQKKVEFSPFDEAKIARTDSALDRLIKEFRQELILFGEESVIIDNKPISDIRFKLADPIYTQKIYASLQHAEDILYENQRGLRLKDGFNSRVRMTGWVEFGEYFCFSLEPSLVIADEAADLDIETGYLKLSLWNMEVMAGRDTIWWGPGYHGSLLLSDNAYPLDLVKISNAHPFFLPGQYEGLGELNLDFFVARLSKKRDYSEPYLSGLRLELSPFDYFNFGLSRIAVFGGKGRPDLDAGDYWDIFTTLGKNELSQDPSANLSDQKAGVDFKLSIPWHGGPCSRLQIYGEWAGEDKFAPWENESPAYLAGMSVFDILDVESLDFRMEYARTNENWYTHGIYTTGYRYKGEILGHHMGGDSEDFFMRLSKDFRDLPINIERLALGGQFDYENRMRSAASPERKYEISVDGTIYLSDTKTIRLLYEYERYRNFENVSGEQSTNSIFELEGKIKF